MCSVDMEYSLMSQLITNDMNQGSKTIDYRKLQDDSESQKDRFEE